MIAIFVLSVYGLVTSAIVGAIFWLSQLYWQFERCKAGRELEFSLDDFEAIWADRKHFLQQQKTQVLWRQNLQSFLNDDGWK